MLSLQRLLLIVASGLLVRSSASPAGAPIPESLENFPSTPAQPSVPSPIPTDPALTSLPNLDAKNLTSIPGAWRTNCNEYTGIPCIAYCSSTDSACQRTGAAVASACAPSWNSYWDVSRGFSPTGPGWRNVTVTRGEASRTVTTTVERYTSFSTASEGFVKQDASGDGQVTVTPIWALGEPVVEETLTTIGGNLTTYTKLEGPLPSCSFLAMSVMDREGCGRCTITGGTVDLFFWPSATSSAGVSEAVPVSTTVINGSILVSPTAYIHLSTVFAADSCSVVGNEHTGTLIGVDPAELSTQIHVGGKVAAYEYGQVDYVDLMGLPPASQYQMQPSCVRFGCPTMYSTTWFPTLKVPPQIRSIDLEWADCVLGLEGLYDPPVALQPNAAAASPTMPNEPVPTLPSPSRTPHAVSPTTTSTVRSIPEPSSPNPGTEEVDSTSTVTLKATAQIIASTRVISIDYSSSERAKSSLSGDITTVTRSTGGPNVPQASLLDPSVLSDGNGVAIGGQTLQTGEAVTFGSGSSKTTLSLQTQASEETLLAFGASDLIVIEPTGQRVHGPISNLYHLPNGEYEIESHTLTPGTVFTVPEGNGQITYSIFTRGGTTIFALGTTQTFAMRPHGRPQSHSSAADLAFTKDSDGNFVLHGTTLLPDRPITVGSGADKTTLAFTSFQSMPAIVIDGSVTEMLTYSTISPLPPITSASATVTPLSLTPPAETASTSLPGSESGAVIILPKSKVLMVAFLILLHLLGAS